MSDLISGLVVLAIVLAFVTRWLRSAADRFRRPVAAGTKPRSPRGLAESGGYQSVPQARREPAVRFPSVARSPGAETPSILKRTPDAPILKRAPGTAHIQSQSVRSALATPGSLRTAILLKEILDAPVSLKDRAP